MVRWLCVITINCERCFSSAISVVKAARLNSSSGASTSSITQNGLGLSRNSENISAIADSAFSPPDSSPISLTFLPGGCTSTLTPASSTSPASVNSSRPLPPRSSLGNSSAKFFAAPSKVSAKRFRASRFRWVIVLVRSSSALCAEHSRAFLELLDLAVGGEVDFADSFQLRAQLDEPRVVIGRNSAVERGNYIGGHRVELGAEFLDKRARQLLAERAGAFALEAAIGRFGFQSRQALLRSLVIRAARLQLTLGRFAIRAQPRKFRFEIGLAGARGHILRGKRFEFALELGALGVRAFQSCAMLIDLRFERVRLAPRVRQFAF